MKFREGFFGRRSSQPQGASQEGKMKISNIRQTVRVREPEQSSIETENDVIIGEPYEGAGEKHIPVSFYERAEAGHRMGLVDVGNLRFSQGTGWEVSESKEAPSEVFKQAITEANKKYPNG